MFQHIPVLPNEVLQNFSSLKKDDLIVDGTLGKGGHSKLLLENGFRVIGIDRDKDAINEASNNLSEFIKSNQLKIVHDNFANIKQVLSNLNITKEKVSGILLDTGVSTHQLENPERGFGFEGELDMRMNQNQTLTAKQVVNEYPEKKLADILYKYGEKVNAKSIARKIVEYRKTHTLETGGQLLKLIQYSMDEHYRKTRKHHWATPTFRALRIEVNKDFENIEIFLKNFTNCLKPNGILEIITFHSLEENLVRKKLRELHQRKIIKLLTKNPIEATNKEISQNPKSKRAKLWIAQIR